jgi:predicted ferric reductase
MNNAALWYASRATGLVSLVLLTAVMVLGALHRSRIASARWPRFVVGDIHRNLSLLAVVFITVHVATAILDPYVHIGWAAAVIPFVSPYQPMWVGLGAVAFDLLIALVGSSLLRGIVPARAWRTVHWAAYGCWPIAVLHGYGVGGADSRWGVVRILDLACIATVLAAVAWRVKARHPDQVVRIPARVANRSGR